MCKHQDVLPIVVAKIVEADPDCGIVVQGSVAEGSERPDSDLDLFVVCSTSQPAWNDLIQQDNCGRMRIKGPVEGIELDIGWQEVEKLASTVKQNGAAGWWMLSQGAITRDPAGHARRCQTLMRDWFATHPHVTAAWAKQQEEVRKRKRDPNYPLEYPTFQEFYRHLREAPFR